MPQRFLRPGIVTSKRFNRLDYQAQSFYIRLLTLVDDYGRYDADAMILRSHVFPLGSPDNHAIDVQTIENICLQLVSNDLVSFYIAGAHEILQIERWNEKPRALVSKYEANSDACKQMFTSANKCSSPSSSPSPSPSPSSSSYAHSKNGMSDFQQFWDAYPRKIAKQAALKAWSKTKGIGIDVILASLQAAKSSADWKKEAGRFIPYPATWLNRGQWADERIQTQPARSGERAGHFWHEERPPELTDEQIAENKRVIAKHKEDLTNHLRVIA